MGKRNVFEMLSNRLSITIVVLTNKTVEYFLKTGSAHLFKLDGKQGPQSTLNRCLINCYTGWFLSVGKRIGGGAFVTASGTHFPIETCSG